MASAAMGSAALLSATSSLIVGIMLLRSPSMTRKGGGGAGVRLALAFFCFVCSGCVVMWPLGGGYRPLCVASVCLCCVWKRQCGPAAALRCGSAVCPLRRVHAVVPFVVLVFCSVGVVLCFVLCVAWDGCAV